MYQSTAHGIRRTEDGALIPLDLGNADYLALLAWQAAGGVIDPEPAPPLEVVRATRETDLAAACAAAITAGVTLDVLGQTIHYPTGQTDQVNLSGAVTLTLLPGLPDDWVQHLTCRDATGTWARRPHTAPQLQAVGRAVAAHVDACRGRLAERRAALAAAGSAEEVGEICW